MQLRNLRPPPPYKIPTSFMDGPSDVTFLSLSTNFSLIACIFLVISFMKIRFSDEASKSNDAGVLGFFKNRSSWLELIDLDAKTRLKKKSWIWKVLYKTKRLIEADLNEDWRALGSCNEFWKTWRLQRTFSSLVKICRVY